MYGLYGLKHHTVEISEDVTRRVGQTNEQTRKDRATQPLDAGRLSFAKIGTRFHVPVHLCLLYTSPSPRDRTRSRMPSSA